MCLGVFYYDMKQAKFAILREASWDELLVSFCSLKHCNSLPKKKRCKMYCSQKRGGKEVVLSFLREIGPEDTTQKRKWHGEEVYINLHS